MAVAKRSVSFRPDVWAEIARITDEEGAKVSALVNEALVYYLALRRGMAAVEEWQSEYGPLTPDEIAEADRVLDEAGVTGGKHPLPWQA